MGSRDQRLITIEQFDSFRSVRDFPAPTVCKAVVERVRTLDEREELEPYFRAILHDSNSTPRVAASHNAAGELSLNRKLITAQFQNLAQAVAGQK